MSMFGGIGQSDLVNYDFAKVRNHLLAGLAEVKQRGYDNYVGEVVLERVPYQGGLDNSLFPLTITFWIRKDDGSYTKVTGKQEFYSFKNLPDFVNNDLWLKKKYDVKLTKEDLEVMYNDRGFEINTDKKELYKIITQRLHSNRIDSSVSVDITDMALYYKVTVFQKDNPGRILSEFLTIPVIGLPENVKTKLESSHRVRITF